MNIRFFNKVPDFKGKRRLARLLLGKTLQTNKDIIVNGKYGLQYKLPNLLENIGFEIMVNGVYEQDTIQFIVNKLPDDGIFVDIGANIGAIVLPVCRLKRNIKAIAVEASFRVFEYLQTNAELNKTPGLVLRNIAVSDSDNKELNFYSPEGDYGKGSFSPVYTDKPETVRTITLDSLVLQEKIQKIDLIKVDVEGYEYDVFKGGPNVLSHQSAPDILFEFLDWAEAEISGRRAGDAQRLLVEYGYNLYEFTDNRLLKLKDILEGRPGMLFATKNKQ